MKNRMSLSRRILYNDNLLKILSLVVAVLFWFIVVLHVSPDYKRTIYGVPVSIDENSATLTSLGLHVVDKSADTVGIVVTGPRNIIGALEKDDFVVTPTLNGISKAGSYELTLAASLKIPDNRIKITKVLPSAITVDFDTMVTKTLPVIVKVEDNNVPDGYLMQPAQSNPPQVTISGPTTELSKVSKAVAYVKVNGDKTKTAVVKSDIKLLDSGDNELNLKHVQLSVTTAEVTIPILKTANVPLTVNFTNLPEGFDKSNIEYTIDPKTLSVAGDEDKINSLTEISLGDVDFAGLDLTTEQLLNIPTIDGILNIENITTAKLSVKLKNTEMREVNTNDFVILNKPSGYTVKNKTKQITGIKLYGPASDISNVSDIVAVIDMSNFQNGTGQYEVPVTFEVPGRKGYWVKGSYHAVVQVTR